MKSKEWHVLTASLLMITMISCAILSPIQPSKHQILSATPAVAPGGGNSGGNSSGNNGGANASPTPVPTIPTPTITPLPTATPTLPATPAPQGPYLVKQIRQVGDETISGEVCSTTRPFSVTISTPKITFNPVFVPADANHGSLSYAYSFPSLGETHDAVGNYTLTNAGTDGTLLLSMTVSDHVVFKGFDGKMPIKYTFNLVPSSNTSCPPGN